MDTWGSACRPIPGTRQAGRGRMDLEASSDSLLGLSLKATIALRQDRGLKEVRWAGPRSGPHFFTQHILGLLEPSVFGGGSSSRWHSVVRAVDNRTLGSTSITALRWRVLGPIRPYMLQFMCRSRTSRLPSPWKQLVSRILA